MNSWQIAFLAFLTIVAIVGSLTGLKMWRHNRTLDILDLAEPGNDWSPLDEWGDLTDTRHIIQPTAIYNGGWHPLAASAPAPVGVEAAAGPEPIYSPRSGPAASTDFDKTDVQVLRLRLFQDEIDQRMAGFDAIAATARLQLTGGAS